MTSQYWPEISFYIREIDRQITGFQKKPITVESIEELRGYISQQLHQIKYSLIETLEDQSISLILFSISAVLDEEILRFITENSMMHWIPLSKDFYGDYIAGEAFYRCIDEALERQKTPQIVFEIFYYCLKRGFKGQYRNSKIQISKYMDLLTDNIPENKNVKIQPIKTSRRPLGRLNLKRSQYYGLAAGCVVVFFVTLFFISNIS